MNRKTIAIIAAALAVCCLAGACSHKNKKDPVSAADPTSKVVSIGEESENLAEFKALFDNYLPYMTYYGQDPLESRASLESFQDWLTDVVSEQLVTLHQAKLAGFKLTDEEEAELSDEIDRSLKQVYEELTKYAEQDSSSEGGTTVANSFESIINSESEYYTGTAMSWEDYKNYFAVQSRNSYLIEAYRSAVCAEFVPTDDDINSWYDSEQETDKANYSEAPEKYKTDEENYELYFNKKEGAYPVTYVPVGYSRIMHIVTVPEGKLSDEYNAKIERMNTLKQQYSELAFEDALKGSDSHKAELERILAEYKALKNATATEFSDHVAKAREKIQRAYKELKEGKPFAEVMLRYTEDERVTGGEDGEGCEAFRTVGELISLDYSCTDDWSDGIKAEFAKLKEGQYSGVFMDGDCYHIIYYSCDETSGDVPIESIYEDIKTVCGIGVQDSQWNALVAEWKKDPELTVDLDLIRTVGIDKLKEEN